MYLYCDTVARLPPRARVPPPRFGVDPLVNLPRGWVLQHVPCAHKVLESHNIPATPREATEAAAHTSCYLPISSMISTSSVWF